MKTIKSNKKAYFDYEILQEFTAGIMLTGPEIKSVRTGNLNLKGAYISVEKGDAFLKNMHISAYPFANVTDYDPLRQRQLLLNKKELNKINNELNNQGVTVIPLEIGLVGKYAKLKIAIARGKKKHDKRETIKSREQKRTLDRLVKSFR